MFSFIRKWFKKKEIKETPVISEKPIININPEVISNIKSEEVKIPNKNPIINGVPKMGRPKKEFDIDQFEKLCKLQCTEQEISSWFQMCPDTLSDKCREVYGKTFYEISHIYRETGKSSLRRTQWMLAEKSAYMAVFLGKNYLHQKDDPLIDQSIHYHYTQISDSELLQRAKSRGIAIPKEMERGVNASS